MATKKPIISFQTPVGDLNWMFISGEGREDDNGNFKYSASVYFNEESDALKSIIAKVGEFWAENKPAKSKKPKSMGIYREVKVLDEEEDEGFKLSQRGYDVTALEEGESFTGRIVISAWTGTTMPDGKAKTVHTFNSKGVKVSLGERKIGSGSRGALKLAAGIYDNGSNKGVSLYLNAVVIAKFVEYVGDVTAQALTEGDWTGDDLNEEGVEPVSDVVQDAQEPTRAKVEI